MFFHARAFGPPVALRLPSGSIAHLEMASPIVACLYKGAKVKQEPVDKAPRVAEAPRDAAPRRAAEAPRDAAPLRETEALPFSANKDRYNKFYYRLKVVPEAMREQWKIVKSQEKINPDAFNQFVEEVISYNAREKTSRKRNIHESEEAIDEGEWMAFHAAEQKEGFEVLMAQIDAGTIQCRRHKGLPPDSAIPWPRNHQVMRLRRTGRRRAHRPTWRARSRLRGQSRWTSSTQY